MKAPYTTVYETKYFEIYHDALGRYWVWNKLDKINHAYRIKDEITAYRKAIDSASHWQELLRKRGDAAETGLAKFEALAEELWPHEYGNET